MNTGSSLSELMFQFWRQYGRHLAHRDDDGAWLGLEILSLGLGWVGFGEEKQGGWCTAGR
jgi:hypothetical protein